VVGKDEVAELARSFNRAAERIERLVTSQRDLLASASHELRSPLTRIRVAIELLAADDRPELRDGVSRDIAELDELIGDLLLAAKMETGETRLRTEAVDLFELVSEEAAAVEAGVTGESLVMRADPKLLRRMLRNLLENARRHGGANISVSLERLGGAEQTVADGAAGRVRLQVADRGPGILESDRVRIFEPFYRPLGHSEEHDGGVGLGLALVQGIAQHHGGEVSCRAREGGGTIFEVILPLVES
jgi:signal transduction histidine kinase